MINDHPALPGDVIAFKAGDVIIVHRLIARLPWPLDRWGLQRGDAHQLGSWIDMRTVIGKVVWPEVSEPTSWVTQAAEIGCHLAWGAASRTKRCVLKFVPGLKAAAEEPTEMNRVQTESEA